jgi:hypothetical protein
MHVQVSTTNACWLWTASTVKGYGQIGAGGTGGRMLKAHRVSWEMHNGQILDGMGVLHSCDTPLCVNPKHLFLGTTADNNKDMVEKGRQVRGSRVAHKTSLTEAKVLEMKLLLKIGQIRSEISKKFNVTMNVVNEIASGRTWRHV